MSKTHTPKALSSFVQLGCWIVGSGADPNPPRAPQDWDVLVPHDLWHVAASLIPPSATPNRFGGWRFVVDGVTIDVWPDSLDRWLLIGGHVVWVWHPKTDTRFMRMSRHTL